MNTSTLETQHNDLTSAYDERTRLFDKLRNPRLTYNDRKQAAADYTAASELFDKLRSEHHKQFAKNK